MPTSKSSAERFFVYTPQNPKVGDLIIFNAASSTNPDGQIISYQWNFGDSSAGSGQATSSVSTATTTHSYSTAGTYTTSLIVFDNQNVSSIATSTIILVASSTPQLSEANHIVISEIQIKGDNPDDEFIELYNPTNNIISLNGYSIQYLSGTATSTANIQKKNFSSNAQIAPKSFFLLVNNNATSSLLSKKDMDYSFGLSGNQSGATIFLVNATISISGANDLVIIDGLSYGNPQLAVSVATSTVPNSNKSLERKAWQNGQCLSSQLDGEFLGNGCDTNNASDFEIRNSPNPQNFQGLPELRSQPTKPENFTVKYSSSTMELNFNWDALQASSTLTYKITDISNTSSTLPTIETASTTAKVSINEIGQDYNFFVQAFDKDGLGSATSTASTTTPSFFSGLYFYQDPRDTSKNLIETYYNQYPFVPNLYYDPPNSSWKLLVFYLNSDAEKQSNIDNFRDYQPNNIQNILAIKYKQCSGGGITQKNSLLLPDISSRCGTEGDAQNIGFVFTELEDNHFIIQTASSSQELILTDQNYLTVAFYSTYSIGVGPIPSFQLVAIDKTKYYFNNLPARQSPQLNGAITLNFDKPNSRLNIDWPKATDADTLDSLLTYEIKYASSADWQTLSGNATSTTKIVSAGDNLSISVRAKDDFGNYSSSLTTDWFYPPTIFYITQTATSSWDTNDTSYCYGCFGRKRRQWQCHGKLTKHYSGGNFQL